MFSGITLKRIMQMCNLTISDQVIFSDTKTLLSVYVQHSNNIAKQSFVNIQNISFLFPPPFSIFLWAKCRYKTIINRQNFAHL